MMMRSVINVLPTCLAVFLGLLVLPMNAFLLRHTNNNALSHPVFVLSTAHQTALKAGMGMGVASGSSKKSKNKKSGGSSKGMGSGSKTKSASTPFDASASLLRLEKKYEEIQQASTRALHSSNDDDDDSSSSADTSNIASEMVVTVRASKSKSAGTSDWVPIAQLCLHPHAEVSSEWAQAAVSLYCRELSFAATMGAKVFSGVPRNDLQYAIEPVDSFYKHVYDPLVEKKNNKKSTKGAPSLEDVLASMTKAEARTILEIDNNGSSDGEERSKIKQSYRKKSFEWHPDRVNQDNLSEEELEYAAREYARIQKAYEVLSSGIRSAGSSWYASLGGRERTDFRVIDLMGQDAASSVLERFRVKSAVAGLDTELVQLFVARNQAAGSTSSVV